MEREGSAKQNKCHKIVPGSYNGFRNKGEKTEPVWKDADKEAEWERGQ